MTPRRRSRPDAEQLLKQMTFTAQFAAVRLLHDTLRTKGESPATLGALSRAYANLGMLTDTQWGAAPWVYKARGLLYAERLRQRDPKDPAGPWHRAYAAALAGMHAEALADLKAADALRGSAAVPEWAVLADALSRFDSAKLEAAAKDGPLADTAAVFHFLTVENIRSPNQALAAGQAVVRRIPECYRVHDALAETGGVGAQHRTTMAGLDTFTKTFPARVSEMPGLPKAVVEAAAGQCHGAGAGQGADRRRQGAGRPGRAVLGGPGVVRPRGPAGPGVPPARVPAVLLRGPGGRLPGRGQAAGRRPPAVPVPGDDPARPGPRPGRDPQAAASPQGAGADLPARVAVDRPGGAWGRTSGSGTRTSPPCTGTACTTTTTWSCGSFRPEQNTAPYARRMLEHSPHAPIARAALVNHDWASAKARAGDWEKEAQHPDVLLALGRRAIADGRTADAERVLGRAIELSPDLATYRVLADAYKKKGDTEKWIATLERYLKEPDPGLGTPRCGSRSPST